MLVEPASWVLVSGQQINPSPAIVADPRFRRALVHALDRQQMVDTLLLGQSSVAHSVVSPAAPEYQDIGPSIVRYDYDPRRAVQLIEELGYARTPAGSFHDGANQRLGFEITSNAEFDIQLKSLFSTADYWQRIGLEAEAVVTPQQRLRDAAFRASYPGFSLQRQPNTNDRLVRFHSSQAPLPENNFTGDNKSRYMNAELDALLDRFFTTIPRRERTAALGQIVHHLTDQLPGFGLFYDVHPLLAHRRIANVDVTNTDWNAHRWEIR
jgi:peptide/nickel transport system substrate-binding protein